LLGPFWPGFWLPQLRLRRRDLRLRGCCGWFNPSFIRIPVSFVYLPNVQGVTGYEQIFKGLVGRQSAKLSENLRLYRRLSLCAKCRTGTGGKLKTS